MTNLPHPRLFQRAIAVTITAAATLTIVAGSAASAAPHRAVIALSGIDLASRTGEARVSNDMARAARRVCNNGGDRALTASRATRACIETALDAATAQLAIRVDAARTARTALADASLPAPIARR